MAKEDCPTTIVRDNFRGLVTEPRRSLLGEERRGEEGEGGERKLIIKQF